MNDISPNFRALPILAPDRLEYHAAVRSFQAHRVLDTRRRARLWFWIAITSWAMIGALSVSIVVMLPLKSILPFYVIVHDDGTVDTAISLSDLGSTMMDKAIRASVWNYVEKRESYSISHAKHNYDIVSLMSAEDVQRTYQQWFLKSADSPQKTIGKNGKISIKEIAINPIRDGISFEVRFWRYKQLDGAREEKTSGTATVEYELLDNVPKDLVLGGDLAGVRIVRYIVEENTP